MESILLPLALLACPVGMGVMMWMMARGQRGQADESRRPQSFEELRAERDRVSAELERAERARIGGRS
jgi:hypothetical protein